MQCLPRGWQGPAVLRQYVDQAVPQRDDMVQYKSCNTGSTQHSAARGPGAQGTQLFQHGMQALCKSTHGVNQRHNTADSAHQQTQEPQPDVVYRPAGEEWGSCRRS